LPNGIGVVLNSTRRSTVGGVSAAQSNVIAYNTNAGVSIGSSGGGPVGQKNTVRGNSIYGNGGLGIDLNMNGPERTTQESRQDPATVTNGFQNFPQLQFAAGGSTTRIVGALHSAASQPFTIDVYANNAAESQGRRYLGSFSVPDPNGSFSFDKYFSWPTQQGD